MIDLKFGGYILKTKGTNGQLVFKSDLLDHSTFSRFEFLFINRNGSKVPYKLDSINFDNHTLNLESCNSPEEASNFIGNEFYIEDKFITNKIEKKPDTQEAFLGFEIINNDVYMGKIIKINDYGMHVTADIALPDETVIAIPLHEDLIEKIELESHQIKMNLPEGLG